MMEAVSTSDMSINFCELHGITLQKAATFVRCSCFFPGKCYECPLKQARISLKMEAVNTSDMSVNFYGTTQRNIPKDIHHHKVVFFSRQMLGVSLEIGKGLIDDGGCRDV
jgi:hypothetical protein